MHQRMALAANNGAQGGLCRAQNGSQGHDPQQQAIGAGAGSHCCVNMINQEGAKGGLETLRASWADDMIQLPEGGKDSLQGVRVEVGWEASSVYHSPTKGPPW